MKPTLSNSTLLTPYFIFVKSDKGEFQSILEKLGLDNWNALPQYSYDTPNISDCRLFYTTWIDGWFQIMDDWNYTLWFDEKLTTQLLDLSETYEIFTCSIGDIDCSFDFWLFRDGKCIREYVVEDPNFDGGFVSKSFGMPLEGEKEALKLKEPLERVINVANSLDINTHHNLDEVTVYWREELEDEAFEFNDDEN